MAGWQTDKRIFTTQKIKQGLRLVLWEIAYSTSIHSSQSIFHCFLKYIFRNRNVRNLRHCFEFHECIKYCGGVFSQQFLGKHMRTMQKREQLVSNRTDSIVSVDERQIKESRGGWQRSLPFPDLSRKIEGPLLAGYLKTSATSLSIVMPTKNFLNSDAIFFV